MTKDQWKLFEDSHAICPDHVKQMFDKGVMTGDESIGMTLAIFTLMNCGETLKAANEDNEDVREFIETSMLMVGALYGRIHGACRILDKVVDENIQLQAENACQQPVIYGDKK